MTRLWNGFLSGLISGIAIGAAAILLLAGLMGPAQAAPAHVDPDGARYAGSANVQQRECMSWAMFAGRVMTLKHKGIPSQHVLSVMFGVADVPEAAHNRIVAIVAEGYVWPRGDEDYQTWTFGQCMQGWPQTPESSSDAGAFFRRTKGQKLYCENRLPFARLIARDLATLKIEQLSFASERDTRTAKDVDWCIKAGQELDACVQRRCMELPA